MPTLGKKGRKVSTHRLFALSVFLMGAGLLAAYTPLRAEPYIAVREGLKCDFCHVNKTGGGMRTQTFAATGDTFLHTLPLPKEAQEASREMTGKLGGRVSLGANLRFSNTTLFRDDPDARGEVPNDRFGRPLESNDFALTEGVAYLEADLVADRLSFYLDESFAPGPATSRETFGLLKGLPWGGYVKAGRFFAPFGLRIQDDGAFIRTSTGFNFTDNSEGVEVGFSSGGAFVAVAVVDSGSPPGTDTRQQVSANAYYLRNFGGLVRTAMVGASAAHNPTLDRNIYGLHGGIAIGQWTLLAEGDLIVDEPAAGNEINRLVSYAEINWLILDRMNLKFAYDYFDPDDDVDEDHRSRYSLVFEPFLYRHLQTRLIYRSVNDVPQNPGGNFNELIAEVHLFF